VKHPGLEPAVVPEMLERLQGSTARPAFRRAAQE
jgi:hypothetical protein